MKTCISSHFLKTQELEKLGLICVPCSRKDKFNPNTSRICSTHFEPTDFENILQHQLLGNVGKLKLKKSSIPSNCKLLKKFKKKTSIDVEILSAYIRQRIFIRINFLNNKIEEEKRQIYKRRRGRDDNKQSNKMRKITT